MSKALAKALLIGSLLLGGVQVSTGLAQQSPPMSEKSKQIESLVNKAATLIESQGKAAFRRPQEEGQRVV